MYKFDSVEMVIKAKVPSPIQFISVCTYFVLHDIIIIIPDSVGCIYTALCQYQTSLNVCVDLASPHSCGSQYLCHGGLHTEESLGITAGQGRNSIIIVDYSSGLDSGVALSKRKDYCRLQ